MTFSLPDREEIQALAADFGSPLDNAAADTLLSYFAPFAEGYRYLETSSAELPPVRYPERSFQFPAPCRKSARRLVRQNRFAGVRIAVC